MINALDDTPFGLYAVCWPIRAFHARCLSHSIAGVVVAEWKTARRNSTR